MSAKRTDFKAVALPSRLSDLLGLSVECPCGRRHEVTTRGAVIGSGVLGEVVPWAREVGRGLRVVSVVDRRTAELAGERVERRLAGDGQRVSRCLVPDGVGGRPHADQDTLACVEVALAAADLAVAVGAGTLNDLTKLASFRRGIPYLVVPTAPSMNGFTSAIAALTQAGLKRTVECHGPLAVVADLDLLATAPAELVAAGLGDLESKPTASADFRLAGWLRGEYYCPAPERVVREAEARVAASAAALRSGEREALATLTEALLLSGLSMKLAGSSSPASGGEHLLSHFWDMTAAAEGRVEGWHGAQVGVATLVSAALYERLRRLDPAGIDPEALLAGRQREDSERSEVLALHGAHAQAVWAEYSRKRAADPEWVAELVRVREGWEELWAALADTLRPVAEIRGVLRGAGAPTTLAELGLQADHLRRALAGARRIRARYTALDLAADLGVLPAAADELAVFSGVLAPPAGG